MQTIEYIHRQDGQAWLGYLDEYPDYWTQGDSVENLAEHLKDIWDDLAGGQI